MNTFVAIDITTDKCTVSLGSVTTHGIEAAEVYSFNNEPINVLGRQYWDTFCIYSHIIEGLRRVARSGADVKSIGITSFGFDFCCIGSDGLPLAPPRTFVGTADNALTVNYYTRVKKAALYKIVATQDLPFKTIFQLDAMQRSGNSSLAAVDKLLFIPETLIYMLTGVMVAEETMVGSSALVNVNTRGLDSKVLLGVGLTPQNFGVFVSPGMMVGRLTDQVRRLTGLSNIPVVAVAGYDFASAVTAAPVTNDDSAFIFSGPYAAVGIESPSPIVGAAAEAANVSNTHTTDSKTLVYKHTRTLNLLKSCFEEWDEVLSPSEINEMVLSATSMRSLIDPDNEMFDNPDKISASIKHMCERTAQRIPSDRAEILKCIIFSIANKHAETLKTILAAARTTVSQVVALGPDPTGGCIGQFIADATGLKVVAGPHNAQTLGNIMVQAVAAGDLHSLQEGRNLIANDASRDCFMPQSL